MLRTFLRDRVTQWSLGIFTSTFVYAVLVLRTVRSGDDDQFVPAVATTVALLLLLTSVALFVAYIHHVSTTIQVSSIIESIGVETREALDRRYPAGRGEPVDAAARPPDDLPSAVLPAPRAGVLVDVDEPTLVRLAAEAGVVLRSATSVGAFVPEGAPLIEVLGDASRLDVKAVTSALPQDRERRLQSDVAFGFRQLVDIAERALSPGINDPTTAVQALDQLHELLRRLATRPLRTGVHLDGEGDVRLVLPPERLDDYLDLALAEIAQYGADSRQVQHRIARMLDDVEAAALPQHRAALTRARALVREQR